MQILGYLLDPAILEDPEVLVRYLLVLELKYPVNLECLLDLADPDTISQAVNEASTDGPLAGLVWAIGSILLKPLARLSVSDFQDTYHTNVIGAAFGRAGRSGAPESRKGKYGVFQFCCGYTGIYEPRRH